MISDHCDWDGLTETIRETGAGEVWVTHGEEDALVHWCGTVGIKARPLHLVGYGEGRRKRSGRRRGRKSGRARQHRRTGRRRKRDLAAPDDAPIA